MKLTKEIKANIVENAVRGTLGDRLKQLETERNALAEIIYNAVYPADIQAAMAKLPDTFFVENANMRFMLDGKHEHDVTLNSSRKVGAVHSYRYNSPLLEVSTTNAMGQRFLAYTTARKQYYDDRIKLRDAMEALLAGISSIKKLLEVWPEGRAYYAAYLDGPLPNAPTVTATAVIAMMAEMGGTVQPVTSTTKTKRAKR